jgi:septal ring factor EnvC (AmiA/AmiB activator)
MHDIITVGLPLIAILFGILLNRQDIQAVRNEIAQLRSEFNGRIDALTREVRESTRSLGRHDAQLEEHGRRIEQLESTRA